MNKVSVIIPTYNVEKYLEECLDSVINQTLKEIEIICVDDGSTDLSGKILDEYALKDKRIKVIHKNNTGYGHSMNVGVKNATGEYIGIVEPDDYIDCDMYRVYYEKAKEHDLDFVKSDFYRFTGKGSSFKCINYKLSEDSSRYNQVINLQKDLTPFKFIHNTWCGIYKREFLVKNNIWHNETPGASFQDIGFWFQTFALAKNVYFLDKSFYYNRRDNENSSVKSKEKVYCVKNENDFLAEFLNKNLDLKKRLVKIYQHNKFVNYQSNLKRIDDIYKKEFLKLFCKEFSEALSDDEIDYDLFNEQEKLYASILVETPEKLLEMSVNHYLEKLFSFYKELNYKSIVFWGASLFLEEFLSKYDIKNVLGVIDINPARRGEVFGKYKIFAPEDLSELNPECVIFSILNKNQIIYPQVKEYMSEKFPQIRFEKNIYEEFLW